MSKQEALDFAVKKDYLDLTAKELLEEYGAGSHIPGSGSASALSALFGIEMMRTVCKITLRKADYANKHTQIQFLLDKLEADFKPRLLKLFKEDIEVFHRVSMYRRQRNTTQDKSQKRKFADSALEEQRRATEIPIEICKLGVEILPFAYGIFDDGFKAVRGDSGVAISNLLSSVSGGLFIIFLNLKDFRKSNWRDNTKKVAEDLAKQLEKFQGRAFAKVLELYEEGLLDSEKQLKFEFIQSPEEVELNNL